MQESQNIVMNETSRLSQYLKLAPQYRTPNWGVAIVLILAGVLAGGCGTINRAINLPFRALESGVRGVDKVLRNPGQVIDRALDTASVEGNSSPLVYAQESQQKGGSTPRYDKNRWEASPHELTFDSPRIRFLEGSQFEFDFSLLAGPADIGETRQPCLFHHFAKPHITCNDDHTGIGSTESRAGTGKTRG